MKQNIRFALTVVFVLSFVAAIWWLLFRQEGEMPSGPEITREEAREAPREPSPPAPSLEARQTPRRLDQGAAGARRAVDRSTTETRRRGVGTVAGLVLDEALEPASGVDVLVQRTRSEQWKQADDEALTQMTDAKGTFVAEGLAYGTYSLFATRGNTAALAEVQVSRYTTGGAVTLQLRPAYSLAGKVVDGQGKPVSEARVTVLHVSPQNLRRYRGRFIDPVQVSQRLPIEVVTDEQGVFSFDRVPVSEAYIAVKAEAYAPHISPLTKLPSDNVVVTLNSGSSIAGRILQADTGELLAGFSLALECAASVDRHETVTNASGEFLCTALRPGEYTLSPADEVWVNAEGTPRIRLTAGEQRRGLELRVTQGGIIRGRVYDEGTGKGVPSASVFLFENFMGHGKAVSTDKKGAYEMRGVPPGEHALAFRVNDRLVNYIYEAHRAATVSMKAGAVIADVDLPIYMGATISGRVEYADGSPAGSATLRVNPLSSHNTTLFVADDKGAFAISGPSSGEQVHLQAFKGTHASSPMNILQVPVTGVLEGIVLTLEEGGIIGGIVREPSGTPVPGINIVVAGGAAILLQPHYVATDDTGRFAVAGLPRGSYTVTASAYGEQDTGDPVEKQVDLAPGQRVNDIELIWDKGVSNLDAAGRLIISGHVMNSDGKPLSDATVSLSQPATRSLFSTKSLIDGSFTLRNLAPGTYELNAMAGANRMIEPVEARAGDMGVRLMLVQQARVSGKVVDAATGNPVTRFGLAFVAPGYTDNLSRQYARWQQYTDSEGAFSLPIREQVDQPRRRNLALAVRADGYALAEQALGAVSAGQNVEGVVVRMRPGARVEGVVQTSAGQPVPGASIHLERAKGGAPEARTDSEGRFTISALPLSEFKLVAAHPAYGNREVSVTPRPGRTSYVTIKLRAGGSVEGIVRLGGQPQPGANVHLLMYGGGQQPASILTDASGRYEFANITSGRGEVRAYVKYGRERLNQSQQIIVETELTTTADFDLPAQTGSLEGFVTVGGQPASSGHVTADVTSEAERTSSYVKLNSDGSYHIESLPVGEVRVSVHISDTDGGQGRHHQETAQIAAGHVTRLDLHLFLPTYVSGHVSGIREDEVGYIGLLPGETKIEPPTMENLEEFMSMLARRAEMNSDGTFRMEDVKPGTYTVVGLAADPNSPSLGQAAMNARMATNVIEVREGQEIAVNLSFK